MTPTEFQQAAPIHADSLPDYEKWISLLRKWNPKINLVAPSAMSDLWARHVLDSAQIWPFIANEAHTIVDFGSGGGFPGLSLAIEAKHAGRGQTVHMIESVGKKANFLKTVSRETSLNAQIHAKRIEDIAPLDADTITARAFAPLTRLLPLANHHIKQGGQLILHKGRSLDTEINAVSDDWAFKIETHQSQSNVEGVTVILTDLKPKS